MSSIGALPFIIETTKAESPFLLSSKNKNRHKFSFFTCRTKKYHNLAVFNDGFSLRFKPVRATGEKGASDDESEDALHATIEKSKKVLAMQRDLLQQIAERRKLVSSIKSSIIDPEVDEAPSEQRENSSPNQDHASSSGLAVYEKQYDSILWKDYVHLTADEVPETSSLDISKGYDGDKRELEQQLPPKKASFHEDSSIQLKVTGSEKVWSDECLLFFQIPQKYQLLMKNKKMSVNLYCQRLIN